MRKMPLGSVLSGYSNSGTSAGDRFRPRLFRVFVDSRIVIYETVPPGGIKSIFFKKWVARARPAKRTGPVEPICSPDPEIANGRVHVRFRGRLRVGRFAAYRTSLANLRKLSAKLREQIALCFQHVKKEIRVKGLDIR